MTRGYERSDTFFRSLTRSTASRSTLAQSGHVHSYASRASSRAGRETQFSCRSCLAACCRAKIITVEPVIFLFMFSLYLYEVMFQLYVFNTYGRQEINKIFPGNETTSQHGASAAAPQHGNDTLLGECLTTDRFDNLTGNHTLGNEVQIKTVILGLIVGTTARLPSIVATLILGPISDRFGRKPAIILVVFGLILHSTVVLVIVEKSLDLHFLILSAGLRGLSGGMAGILTASYSYVADISSKRWLTIRLGVLESMNFIAGSLSLIIGGVLIHYSNCQFDVTAILSLACVVAALPYVLIALPESLERDERKGVREEREKARSRTLGPKALLRGFQIFFGKHYSRCKLWLCLFIMFITVANISGTTSVIILYLLRDPLHWNPLQIGAFLGSNEFVHGLGLIVLLPILVHCGTKDSIIVVLSVFLTCMMDACLGLATKTWQVFVGEFVCVCVCVCVCS